MEIITNHQWRPLLCGSELPAGLLANFDWLDDPETDCGFFMYRGAAHNVAEFMRASPDGVFALAGFDGVATDTYFSGTLIKLSRDGESVKVARFYS